LWDTSSLFYNNHTEDYTGSSISSDVLNISPSLSQSSPTAKPEKFPKLKPISKRKLRVISVNFQSMTAKQESFWCLLEEGNRDNILASEIGIHAC
jgi:hypothetical protein